MTAPPSPLPDAARFRLLDPLRGLAALAVVFDHVAGVKIGYFAVLVFFIISGYCIMASVQASLARNLSVGTYFKRRIRRIYPPYLASVAFFAITRLIKWRLGGGADAFDHPLYWLQTLTLTQWLDLIPGHQGYPHDNPALLVIAHWSLNYEEQFYLFTGLLMVATRRWATSLLVWFLPFTALSLLLLIFLPQLCIGFFVDYWPLFALGAIVFFASDTSTPRPMRRVLLAIPALVLVATSLILVLNGRGLPNRRSAWEDLVVGSAVACLLLAVRRFDARVASWTPVRWLARVGTVSYSLYLIHQFNVALMQSIARLVVSPEAWPLTNVAVQLALHIALASAFWWSCERPFLNTRSSGPRTRAGTEPTVAVA